jgi:hypothetical protein
MGKLSPTRLRAVKKFKSVRRITINKRIAKAGSHRACEDFCCKVVKHGRSAISAAVVERALGMADVPLSANRKNVIPKGKDAIKGAVCGLFVFADLIGVSSFSRRFPWLTRLLVAFCHKEQPGFKFTSIQVNVNYASRPHVDRNNLGESFIIGLGKYTGGSLWVHSDNGSKAHTLDEDITGAPMYKKGDTYMGRDTNIHHRWTRFDGNRLHCTRPFCGTRFSLVYFTCDRYAESSLQVREELKGMAFPFRWESVKLQKMLATKRVERQRIQKLFAKERNSLHQGVVSQLLDDDKLRYESENPKRDGCNAYLRYKKYSRARTVGEAVKLGAQAIDFNHDYNHGFMHVVGLNTRPVDWDFEVRDFAFAKRSYPGATCDPSETAVGKGEGSMVKVRVAEMNASHKGIDVPRKSLALLAARVSKLSRTPDSRWASETSPTAKIPLAALRCLLHWASSGRLCCSRGSQKEAVRTALEAWGECALATRVQAEGQEDEEEDWSGAARNCSVKKCLAKRKEHVCAARFKVKKKGSSRRGCPTAPTDAIRFEQTNPKAAGSSARKRYEKYKKAKTVQQAIDLGACGMDLKWDFKRGFCKRR